MLQKFNRKEKCFHTKVLTIVAMPFHQQTIQQAMTAAITKEEGGGIEERDAMDFMERLVRKEDRFHTECF
jgi:hypothetical protein